MLSVIRRRALPLWRRLPTVASQCVCLDMLLRPVVNVSTRADNSEGPETRLGASLRLGSWRILKQTVIEGGLPPAR